MEDGEEGEEWGQINCPHAHTEPCVSPSSPLCAAAFPGSERWCMAQNTSRFVSWFEWDIKRVRCTP